MKFYKLAIVSKKTSFWVLVMLLGLALLTEHRADAQTGATIPLQGNSSSQSSGQLSTAPVLQSGVMAQGLPAKPGGALLQSPSAQPAEGSLSTTPYPQGTTPSPELQQPQGSEGAEAIQPVLAPSRAERFFSAPAPEMGALFRGSSLIDTAAPPVESLMDRSLIVPDVDRTLQQYGYDFFAATQTKLVQDQMAPVSPDYVVGPGDHLLISIWGSIEASQEVIVGRSGEVILPKVGSISVWGQSFAQVKETIRKHIAKYYSGFDLSVSMAGLRSIRVFIVGEVVAPGTYTVSSLSRILTALVEAGGPTKTGSLRNIQLRRSGKLVDTIDFYDFLLDGDNSHDQVLQDGDTIFVPVVGALVGVAGDVRRPAIYELQKGETLQSALEMAGGLNKTAFLGQVQIERIDNHTRRVVVDIDLEKANSLSVEMQDQDLVKVSSISPMPTSYVRLAGFVSRPGPYQFRPGMRVADLILPYDNLLPMHYPKMAEILRLDPPEFRPRKITIDLGLALAGDPDNNIELQEFDELRLFSRDEMEVVPEVRISGAVQKPGTYRLFEGMTIRDLVVAASNLRDDAYLADAELTQYFEVGQGTRTEQLMLNLGKAMQGDPKNNLQLRSGDHLLVRSIPEFNRKYVVKVEGQVLFPGSYTITKGERLSSVLQRAGGFSSDAYLRGAVFTRQSVEALVRERLERFIMQEEKAIAGVASEMAQGAFSEADVKAAQSLLDSRKQLVDNLKSVPVIGRMVVQLAPLETFRGSEYDIELQNGDTISIPEIPNSVTVLGEVYNPTTITYKEGKTASFYLSVVGGPNENANEDEMFIVRADGSVNSRQQGSGDFNWDNESHRWLSGGFDSVVLYPGDTILVPQQFRRIDWLREIKDVTLIMYQMALGAAAVRSF